MSQEAKTLGSTVIENGSTPARARHAPSLTLFELRDTAHFCEGLVKGRISEGAFLN